MVFIYSRNIALASTYIYALSLRTWRRKERETGLFVLCSERTNVDSHSRIRSGAYAWESHARKVARVQKLEGGQKSGPAEGTGGKRGRGEGKNASSKV